MDESTYITTHISMPQYRDMPPFIRDRTDVDRDANFPTFAESQRVGEELQRLAAVFTADLVEHKFECKVCGRTLSTTSVKTRDRRVCCGCYVIEALSR